MLKWKGFDKHWFRAHQVTLRIWLALIVIGLAIILGSEYGSLNIWFSRHYNASLGMFFRYMTHFGEEEFLVPLSLIIIFLVRDVNLFIQLAFTFIFNSLTTVLFKFLIFDYARPKVVLEKYHLKFTQGVEVWSQNSFPSGHTSAAFAFAFCLSFWFNTKWLTAIVLILAMAVGVSRIYLQQHFLEDITGGSIIGFFSAALANRIVWAHKIKE